MSCVRLASNITDHDFTFCVHDNLQWLPYLGTLSKTKYPYFTYLFERINTGTRGNHIYIYIYMRHTTAMRMRREKECRVSIGEKRGKIRTVTTTD